MLVPVCVQYEYKHAILHNPFFNLSIGFGVGQWIHAITSGGSRINQTGAPTYHSAKFFKKLHEKTENRAEMGRASLCPLNPPMIPKYHFLLTKTSLVVETYQANFGSVTFPADVRNNPPAQLSVGTFMTRAHDVRSGTVTILDSRTIRITNLHYDGTGPRN